jgi:hypothetical protein
MLPGGNNPSCSSVLDWKKVSAQTADNFHISHLLSTILCKVAVTVSIARSESKPGHYRNSLRNTDALLVAVTCLYVACKVEECPHHVKSFTAEMRKILPGL